MLVLLVLATPASAAHRRHTAVGCPTGHTRLVAADTQAQVFKALNSFALDSIYGCVYGRRHAYLLGESLRCGGGGGGGRCYGIAHVALAGSIVAYEENLENGSSGGWVVVVRDLRTGQVLRKLPSGSRTPPRAGPPLSIVVKSDGAVAWVVQTRVATSQSLDEFEIYAGDSTGTRLLASGPGIEPASLALAGSSLYWMQAGHPASALLN
jgi:hypothetical protein